MPTGRARSATTGRWSLPGPAPGRTRVTTTSLLDSLESRDAVLRSGMDVGVREGHERLDELLAAQA